MTIAIEISDTERDVMQRIIDYLYYEKQKYGLSPQAQYIAVDIDIMKETMKRM